MYIYIYIYVYIYTYVYICVNASIVTSTKGNVFDFGSVCILSACNTKALDRFIGDCHTVV